MLEPLSGHPGHPPLTRPSRYLAWLAGRQKGLLSFALIMAIIEAASLAAVPFLLGRALDDGLESGLSAELLISVAWLVGIGILVPPPLPWDTSGRSAPGSTALSAPPGSWATM